MLTSMLRSDHPKRDPVVVGNPDPPVPSLAMAPSPARVWYLFLALELHRAVEDSGTDGCAPAVGRHWYLPQAAWEPRSVPLLTFPVPRKLVTGVVTEVLARTWAVQVGGHGLVLQQRQRPVQAEVEPVAVPVPLPF